MTTAAVGSQGPSGLPAMDDEQFGRWVALVERRTGMAMPAERKSFLVTSVGLRMREVGFKDYESYYQHVISGVAGNLEWAELVDRLTVHETRFFRDPKAMKYLVDQVLPALTRDDTRELNVWSVGCSTGEEVYTLAMAITDALKRRERRPYFGVTGTDISLHALGVARQGEYPMRRLHDIPEAMRLAYCEVLPGAERFRIAPSLRRRVCFAHMNVLDVLADSSRLVDVISCQNLLIYFGRTRRQAIVEGLARHLHPGGILLLGAGEFVRGCPEGIERAPDAGQVLAFRRQTP